MWEGNVVTLPVCSHLGGGGRVPVWCQVLGGKGAGGGGSWGTCTVLGPRGYLYSARSGGKKMFSNFLFFLFGKKKFFFTLEVNPEASRRRGCGWYASCGHAGGLSCFTLKKNYKYVCYTKTIDTTCCAYYHIDLYGKYIGALIPKVSKVNMYFKTRNLTTIFRQCTDRVQIRY